jgi:predicted transcriptional regulator of viral defense system
LDLVEGRLELVLHDGEWLVIDVEPGEERAVQLSSYVLRALLVETNWVGHEREALAEPLGA